jgi:hypothetical protein
MWITTAWQRISPDITVKGFKQCCVSSAMMGLMMCCGMTVKRMGMLGVSVRKMKAMIVRMETITLLGTGRKTLTCFAY